jgi:hypothetical protein
MAENTIVDALLWQMTWWWDEIFRPRIDGLGDEEHRWEPTPGSWSIHPVGDGLVEYDFHWPPPKQPPVTTIAWRLCHVGVGCLAVRASQYFPHVASEPGPRRHGRARFRTRATPQVRSASSTDGGIGGAAASDPWATPASGSRSDHGRQRQRCGWAATTR